MLIWRRLQQYEKHPPKRHQTDCVWKSAPRCFLLLIVFLFLEGLLRYASLYLCVMKPFQPACIWEEKQIRIIIVTGSSLSSVQRLSLENQHAAARTAALSFLYAMQQGSLSSSYTSGPSHASASTTKLCLRPETPFTWTFCLLGRNKKGERIERRRRVRKMKEGETAAVGERRSSSILMCANSPAPAD